MTRPKQHPLYHFTCDHGHSAIGERGRLMPGPFDVPGIGQVIWLTDDPKASRDDLGLTSTLLSCDRMQYLYRTTGPYRAIRWVDIRGRCRSQWRTDIESFGRPSVWWIAKQSIPVRLMEPKL